MNLMENQKLIQKLKYQEHENRSEQDKLLSEEKVTLNRKLRDGLKQKEQQQTHELLIVLVNEMFEKMDGFNPKKEPENSKIVKSKRASGNHNQKQLILTITFQTFLGIGKN